MDAPVSDLSVGIDRGEGEVGEVVEVFAFCLAGGGGGRRDSVFDALNALGDVVDEADVVRGGGGGGVAGGGNDIAVLGSHIEILVGEIRMEDCEHDAHKLHSLDQSNNARYAARVSQPSDTRPHTVTPCSSLV